MKRRIDLGLAALGVLIAALPAAGQVKRTESANKPAAPQESAAPAAAPAQQQKPAATATTTEARLRKIIAEQLGVPIDKVQPTSSFVDDLGADSLDTVELCMAVEEEFELDIPDEDAEKITTVGSAINYVEKRQAK